MLPNNHGALQLAMAEGSDSGIAEKAADFRSRLAAAYHSARRLVDEEAQLVILLKALELREGAPATSAQLALLSKLGNVQARPRACTP